MHDVGRLRISLADAQLRDYDPVYGEFTVRALSPASQLQFSALGHKVVTRFGNGDTAPLWRVSAGQVQALRDKLNHRTATLDVLLKITDVLPAPGGGAIVTDIEQFTLRAGEGSTLARLP